MSEKTPLGTFTPLSTFGGGTYQTVDVSAIADVNGDGIPDLVAAQVNGDGFRTVTDGVFLGNGDGTFGPFIQSCYFNALGLLQTFQLAEDMNGDHKPDLVLGALAGNVFVLLNTTQSGFTLSATPLSPAAIAAGNSATSTVSVRPNFGFTKGVTLSCSSITLNGSPAITAPPTCSFSPSSVANASGTSKLTISTTASSALLGPTSTHPPGLFYAMLSPLIGMALIGAGFSAWKKNVVGVVLGCLMISGLIFLAACGGSGGGGGGGASTPAGSYTITVSGSAGSTANTTTVTLVVQ